MIAWIEEWLFRQLGSLWACTVSNCPIFSIVCQGHMPRKHFHCFSSLQEKQGRQAHAYLQTDESKSCVWIITWDCFSFTGWLTRAASGLLTQSSALAEGNGCIALKNPEAAQEGLGSKLKANGLHFFFQVKSKSFRLARMIKGLQEKKKKVCCQGPYIPHWFSILGSIYD